MAFVAEVWEGTQLIIGITNKSEDGVFYAEALGVGYDFPEGQDRGTWPVPWLGDSSGSARYIGKVQSQRLVLARLRGPDQLADRPDPTGSQKRQEAPTLLAIVLQFSKGLLNAEPIRHSVIGPASTTRGVGLHQQAEGRQPAQARPPLRLSSLLRHLLQHPAPCEVTGLALPGLLTRCPQE